jgi:hypothetical protein
LSFVTKILELRHLGLPLTWPPALEVSCKQNMKLLQQQSASLNQFAAAAGSSSSSRQGTTAQAAAAAPLHHPGSSSSGRRRLASKGSVQGQRRHPQQHQLPHLEEGMVLGQAGLRQGELFAQMDEHVWRTACLALQHAALGSTASTLSSGVAEAAGRALPLAAAAAHAVRSSSQAPMALDITAADSENLLTSCERVSWHTARFMQPEYAKDVGRDSGGGPVKAPDAVLPVLWLNSVPTAFAADGCCSLMDVLQQKALPAAVQWVNEHIEKLPYLTQ